MTEPTNSNRRVRLPFVLALGLAVIATAGWSLWDFVEARRLESALADARGRGLLTQERSAPAPDLTTEGPDAAHLYRASADALPGWKDVVRLSRAFGSGTPAPSAQDLATAAAILRASETAFHLASLAKSAPVTPRTAGQEDLYPILPMMSFRTAVAARTGHLDDAWQSLLDEVAVTRVVEDAGGRPGALRPSGVLSVAATDLGVLLSQQAPPANATTVLAAAFARDLDHEPVPVVALLSRALSGDAVSRALASTVITRPSLRARITRLVLTLVELHQAVSLPWPQRLERLASLASDANPKETLGLPLGLRVSSPDVPLGAQVFLGGVLENERYLAQGIALARSARVALAVEVFRRTAGHPPATLNELVPTFLAQIPADPFTGSPLKYVSDAAGYRVYSVSINGKDDGGDFGGGLTTAEQRYAKDVGLRVSRPG
jgi:hypothetical protein